MQGGGGGLFGYRGSRMGSYPPLGRVGQHAMLRERPRQGRAIVRLGHALAGAKPRAMGHVVRPQYLCPTMVDPRFRHGPLGQSVHVTKAAHTFIETNRDGASRWKNVGMPHNVEGAGGESGKGVNDERIGERTKEEKKKKFSQILGSMSTSHLYTLLGTKCKVSTEAYIHNWPSLFYISIVSDTACMEDA